MSEKQQPVLVLVNVERKDHPEDVADKFVEALRQLGVAADIGDGDEEKQVYKLAKPECKRCKHFTIGPDGGHVQHNGQTYGLCLNSGSEMSRMVPVFSVAPYKHAWPIPIMTQTSTYVHESFGCADWRPR